MEDLWSRGVVCPRFDITLSANDPKSDDTRQHEAAQNPSEMCSDQH